MNQLRELSTYAAERGVGLGVEPLNRFETSFINLTSQAIEVVDRVGHPACGLLLDTFHMNIEERSIGDAIRSAGPRMRQLHACENDRGAPGSGHVPWNEVAAACKRHRLQRAVRDRVVYRQGEVDRPRGCDLAQVRGQSGRAGGERAALSAHAFPLSAAGRRVYRLLYR